MEFQHMKRKLIMQLAVRQSNEVVLLFPEKAGHVLDVWPSSIFGKITCGLDKLLLF